MVEKRSAPKFELSREHGDPIASPVKGSMLTAGGVSELTQHGD